MRFLSLLLVAGCGVCPLAAAQSPAFPTDAATLALYTFDGAHADTTFDVSGNGYHGLHEGTTSVPGRHGHARQFDGVDDRVDLDAARIALQGATEWTLEYIARAEGSSIPHLLSHPCRNGWRLVATGGSANYGIKTTGSSCTWVVNETVAIGPIGTDWHYFALVYGNGTLSLYLDGQHVQSRNASGTFLGGGGGHRAWIGHDDFGGAYYSGLADELRISAVARSGEEVCTTANALGWACVVVAGEEAPDEALALTVAPTPARGSARLGYALAAPGAVRLSLHDALGREMALLASGPRTAGAHEVSADLTGLAPGVYLVRLATEAGVVARRLTVVR